tara:strand:- start:439 stop:771 length:333 start_codon:yes stop_codon:yes gene_type:complete
MNDIYEIKNLGQFAKGLAKEVARSSYFSFEQLKNYITVKNIKNIIKDYASKDKKGCYVIDEIKANAACEDILDWLIGVDLARMCAEDILDCYWDDKQNCMVFMEKKEKKE